MNWNFVKNKTTKIDPRPKIKPEETSNNNKKSKLKELEILLILPNIQRTDNIL